MPTPVHRARPWAPRTPAWAPGCKSWSGSWWLEVIWVTSEVKAALWASMAWARSEPGPSSCLSFSNSKTSAGGFGTGVYNNAWLLILGGDASPATKLLSLTGASCLPPKGCDKAADTLLCWFILSSMAFCFSSITLICSVMVGSVATTSWTAAASDAVVTLFGLSVVDAPNWLAFAFALCLDAGPLTLPRSPLLVRGCTMPLPAQAWPLLTPATGKLSPGLHWERGMHWRLPPRSS